MIKVLQSFIPEKLIDTAETRFDETSDDQSLQSTQISGVRSAPCSVDNTI